MEVSLDFDHSTRDEPFEPPEDVAPYLSGIYRVGDTDMVKPVESTLTVEFDSVTNQVLLIEYHSDIVLNRVDPDDVCFEEFSRTA